MFFIPVFFFSVKITNKNPLKYIGVVVEYAFGPSLRRWVIRKFEDSLVYVATSRVTYRDCVSKAEC